MNDEIQVVKGETGVLWIAPESYIPLTGVEVECLTEHGIRNAIGGEYFSFRAIDCTHPMQNTNLTGCVIGWRFVHETDARQRRWYKIPPPIATEKPKLIKKWWQKLFKSA